MNHRQTSGALAWESSPPDDLGHGDEAQFPKQL
uniref:Uncharacterized protein n=1 Tax=Plectus sambesii TaxID=2011161 RepID=A0A914XN88_9BILA